MAQSTLSLFQPLQPTQQSPIQPAVHQGQPTFKDIFFYDSQGRRAMTSSQLLTRQVEDASVAATPHIIVQLYILGTTSLFETAQGRGSAVILAHELVGTIFAAKILQELGLQEEDVRLEVFDIFNGIKVS